MVTGNDILLKVFFFLATLILDNVKSAKPFRVRNSERITISLGDFDEGLDDLEMISESENHALVNQKLERFHDFVRNCKVMKRPWDKLFIKSIEYRKSERSYDKVIKDTTNRMKDVNSLNRKKKLSDGLNMYELLKMINSPNGDNGQNTGKNGLKVEGMNDDDDDDDDDEEENSPMNSLGDSKELQKQYQNQIATDENEKAFTYSDKGKPEENLHEIFDKIFDMKTPENCTTDKGIGIKSIKCILENYKNKVMTGKQALGRLFKILLVWCDIYLTIAIPLWLIKGWGCCCITWKYFHPQKMVHEVQTYISENPPGVYVNEFGEEEHYDASAKEKELYDEITKKLLRM